MDQSSSSDCFLSLLEILFWCFSTGFRALVTDHLRHLLSSFFMLMIAIFPLSFSGSGMYEDPPSGLYSITCISNSFEPPTTTLFLIFRHTLQYFSDTLSYISLTSSSESFVVVLLLKCASLIWLPHQTHKYYSKLCYFSPVIF